MASLNKTFLLGNLTRDPELKYTPSGTAVCKFGIAVNRKWKDKEETLFIDIVAWAALAENCSKYLAKGDLIALEGYLKYDTWENDKGFKQSKHYVVANDVQFLPKSETKEKPKESDEEIPF
jgi:single-strand DNA-binding protein